jgi:NADPH:quinone reductase-like Zn-dependent oxidoreductase
VFDCAGGRPLEDAWRVVKEGGTVISVAEPPEGKRPKEGLREGVNAVWFIVEPDGKMLESVTKGIDKGEYVPVVDSVWSLKEYEKAFEIVQNGHPKGKVVLKVKE